MSEAGTARPGVLSRVGRGITALRNFVLNAVFLLLLIVICIGLLTTCQGISVPSDSALIINPRGVIVEARHMPVPFAGLVPGTTQVREVELNALLTAIDHAATDDDIRMLILDLDELVWAAPAHGERLGAALTRFREQGKKVVSYANFYSQAQYHIASFADALYMHPMGQVVLEGFGGFNFYLKDLLDRFAVNVHVFRVGDYKAAIEPLTRNDMSEASRMDNEALYQNIWQQVLDDIATNRAVDKADLQAYADNLGEALATTGGDLALAAVENHLIDELMSADQAQVRLADDVGFSDQARGDINGIDYRSYLEARSLLAAPVNLSSNKIAVIVAQGMIVNQSTSDTSVSLDDIVPLIRQAKEDPAVRAVVVRVDSPGGSQFASELIRQELELVQLAEKPVVASFGANAASGGYWIAATADAIVAESTTITGSIGIFSLIPTFEEALSKYGVHTDGVGTTSLTLSGNPFTGINEPLAEILQARVEHGYTQFVNLVARGRDMSPDAVDAIAQGRIWTGDAALELGLVDELGGLQTALEQAAHLAGLEEWDSVTLRPGVDPRSMLLAELFGPLNGVSSSGAGVWRHLQTLMATLGDLDDPGHTYALCEACWLPSPFKIR